MPLAQRSYFVQKSFKNLLHNYHDFFMIAAYTITINRKQVDAKCQSAYKIFFIILELISDYQLSSLLSLYDAKDRRCSP